MHRSHLIRQEREQLAARQEQWVQQRLEQFRAAMRHSGHGVEEIEALLRKYELMLRIGERR
jgi:predicted metal-dependent hydrolase